MKHARKVLKVSGSERAKFLNDLLTIEVTPQMQGLRYGALLSPQGKIIADIFIWSDQDALYLDIHESVYAGVRARLGMYKLRADVQLEDTDLEVFQTQSGDDPRCQDIGGRCYKSANEAPPDDGLSNAQYLRARISARVPEFGVDFQSDEAYPIEWRFGEMNGINYRKGCYVGQEIAARMRHKTELQKTLYCVSVSGPASLGDAITSDDKPAGKLCSIDRGDAIAFLRVKRKDGLLKAGSASLVLNEFSQQG